MRAFGDLQRLTKQALAPLSGAVLLFTAAAALAGEPEYIIHNAKIVTVDGKLSVARIGWGGPLGPDQGLSREDAIRSVTIDSAHTTFDERVKGSIESGKYADFVVLSRDILTIPADDISTTKVLATMLGGKPVFGDITTAASAQ